MDKNQARMHFNCSNDQPVLAILGGSQGSVPLNHHFQENYSQYTDSGIQLLWQCGNNQYNSLKDNVKNNQVKLIPFSDDMGALYSASDLIILAGSPKVFIICLTRPASSNQSVIGVI